MNVPEFLFSKMKKPRPTSLCKEESLVQAFNFYLFTFILHVCGEGVDRMPACKSVHHSLELEFTGN